MTTLQDLPGQELFQYVGEDGTPSGIDSSDVNAYLREVGGEEISAKVFRTWAGTVREIHVKLGDRVSQGSRVATLEVDEAGAADAPASEKTPSAAGAVPTPDAARSAVLMRRANGERAAVAAQCKRYTGERISSTEMIVFSRIRRLQR